MVIWAPKTVFFDVIALQEIWQLNEPDIFQLPGYQKRIYRTQSNNVQGGGVGLFVKNYLKVKKMDNFSVFIDRIIETQFIEIEIRNLLIHFLITNFWN